MTFYSPLTRKYETGSEIYSADQTGSVKRLTYSYKLPYTMNLGPSYSADKSRITYASNISGNFDIYIMNADGTGSMKAAGGNFNEYKPRLFT